MYQKRVCKTKQKRKKKNKMIKLMIQVHVNEKKACKRMQKEVDWLKHLSLVRLVIN